MSKRKKIFSALLLPLLLAGCSTITNLTPSQYPRNPSGYYRVEAAWRTKKETIRPDSITVTAQVGPDNFDMRKVPVVDGRWETFIPVPAGVNEVYYHYKFDFLKDAFGPPQPDSLMSREYRLKIAGGK
jgi:hypothetical protein